MSDTAILTEKVSKQYRIGQARNRHDTLRDQVMHGLKSALKWRRSAGANETFWALKNVSFQIRHGEAVGIIGSNGAGKSTLLKILSRITAPTSGLAEIYGRVGSLLEVGTGFHPELTGRENIFLNGVILGMKRVEIQQKFDEIVAFAEMDKFLDTPVKRYSSGMQIRLAFAVAAHLEPEILLIDEVLAVGDVAFQKKCLGKMQTVARQGRTVLFVSHNLAAVENLCDRGIVLRKGEQVFQGPAKEAVRYYLNKVAGSRTESETHVYDLTNAPGRQPSYPPLLTAIEIYVDGDVPFNGNLRMGGSLRIRIRCKLHDRVRIEAALGFDSIFGQRVFTAHTLFQPGFSSRLVSGEQVLVCDIPSVPFTPGEYKVLVALGVDRLPIDVVEDAARINVTEADFYGTSKVPWNGLVVLKHHWHLDD